MAEFKAAEYLKMAARERVSYTVMVPAMYNLCLLRSRISTATTYRAGASAALAARRCRSPPSNSWTPRSRPEAGELLRRDRDHVAVDHDARRTDRQPYRQRRLAAVRARRSSSWTPNGRELPRGEIGEIWISRRLGHQGLLEQPEGHGREFHGRLLAFRRSRLDRCREFRPRIRSPEGHDQPRRPENLFRGGQSRCWLVTPM